MLHLLLGSLETSDSSAKILLGYAVCHECRNRHNSWADIRLLRPAAPQIQDLERFKHCLALAVGQARAVGWDTHLDITPVLRDLPICQQLQPDDWVNILPDVLLVLEQLNSKRLRTGQQQQQFDVHRFPVLEQLTAEQMHTMLQRAIKPLRSQAAAQLCAMPAAQQVHAEALGDLLHRCVDVLFRGVDLNRTHPVFQALLSLPAAGQLSLFKVQKLLRRACDVGWVAAAQRLLGLPQAAGLSLSLSFEHVSRAIGEALERIDPSEAIELLEISRDSGFCADEVTELLVQCLSAYKAHVQEYWRHDGLFEVLQALQRLPAFQELSAPALVHVMSQSIQCLGVYPWCLRPYVTLPAAANITVDQLTGNSGLLRCCCIVNAAPDVWQDLFGLSAAKQIRREAVYSLLLECVKPCAINGVVMLCKLPVLKHGDVATAVSLLEACMEAKQTRTARVLLAQLPAMRRLTAEQVHELVQLSIQLDCTEACKALLKLPIAQAAVKADAVLQAVLDL